MSSVAGNQVAVLVRTETGFDRQSGKFLQKVWEGTEQAINGVEAELGLPDYYLKGPAGGGKWTLTARYGAFTEEGNEEVPVNEERLRFNQIQKSIYSNPLFSSLSTVALNEVRTAVDNREPLPSPSLPLQDALYAIAVAGIDAYMVFQPVVIVTDTASAAYPWDIGFTDYGTIFDTAEMIADAELSSGWKSNLPSGGSPPSGFVYGWLKKPPEIVTVAGNKTQLVQEYEYGLWATALFNQS